MNIALAGYNLVARNGLAQLGNISNLIGLTPPHRVDNIAFATNLFDAARLVSDDSVDAVVLEFLKPRFQTVIDRALADVDVLPQHFKLSFSGGFSLARREITSGLSNSPMENLHPGIGGKVGAYMGRVMRVAGLLTGDTSVMGAIETEIGTSKDLRSVSVHFPHYDTSFGFSPDFFVKAPWILTLALKGTGSILFPTRAINSEALANFMYKTSAIATDRGLEPDQKRKEIEKLNLDDVINSDERIVLEAFTPVLMRMVYEDSMSRGVAHCGPGFLGDINDTRVFASFCFSRL